MDDLIKQLIKSLDDLDYQIENLKIDLKNILSDLEFQDIYNDTELEGRI